MPARLLVIMGSGETTPTMAKVHRQVFEHLGPGRGPALLVGTPYGFQSNAEEISARAVAYFGQSVGARVEVLPLARPLEASPREIEEAMARIAQASWLFAGPGSPTYACRQWRATSFAQLVRDKLSYGGAVVFSSAAAIALGRWAVPVYEIYKVGADPVWAEGLDVLGTVGLDAAVVAHFDNAEGGTHDTRYCYLGEGRLSRLEEQLPEDGWVLGVDEHTACVIDLEEGTASVRGLGGVTVRRHGRASRLETGASVGLSDLASLAASLGTVAAGGSGQGPRQGSAPPAPPVPGDGRGPGAGTLLGEAHRLSAVFDRAMSERDGPAAIEAVLALEAAVHDWAADTEQSDHVDRARAGLRRMVARLGEVAAVGLLEPRALVAPWVRALLDERAEARQSKRFADGDRIRDRLVALGIEVRDTPEGSEWEMRAAAS
jgi:cyanophycinase-like exopeptidase